MPERFRYILLLFTCVLAQAAFAQTPTNPNYPGGPQRLNTRPDTGRAGTKLTDDQLLDTMRSRQERKRDTVVFNSKFIRVTNEKLLIDSTQLFALDTSLVNFQNYSPLNQPRSPRIYL